MQIKLTFIKYLKQVKIELERCYNYNKYYYDYTCTHVELAGTYTCSCDNSLDLIFVEVAKLIKSMPSWLILCIPGLDNWVAADWPIGRPMAVRTT